MKENRTPPQVAVEKEKQTARAYLLDDDDEDSTRMQRIRTSIRRANQAFENHNYVKCQGILSALKETYPFISQAKIDWKSHNDWKDIINQDKETLSGLLRKIEKVDLNASVEGEAPKAKGKRAGFLGKIFGSISNPSASSGYTPAPKRQEVQLEQDPQTQLQQVQEQINLQLQQLRAQHDLEMQSKPVERTNQAFNQLSYADINAVFQEFKKKPAYSEEHHSPNFVKLYHNMSSQGYDFTLSNMFAWVAVHNQNAPDQNPDEALGWKFHIGLDEEPNNLQKGMDIVTSVLMKHQVSDFKLAQPGSVMNKTDQVGKQVTIYAEFDNNKDWKPIFEEIETQLHAAGIKPAPNKAQAENHLGVSKFISYRNDKGRNGEYVDAGFAPNYNPSGKPDPFIHILAEEKAKPKSRM